VTWVRGRARNRCNECGLLVDGDDVQEWQNRYWQADAHKAPCGTPCMGGVLTSEERSAGVHGRESVNFGKWCPGCQEAISRAWRQAKADVAKLRSR
jgi:hypothetical protein